MTKTQPRPTVAEFIRERLLETPKTQREIARESGFEYPNVITMLKQGSTKLPLNRVGPLARALDVDPVVLLRLAMSEYMPDTWAALEPLLSAEMLSADERRVVEAYRHVMASNDSISEVIAGREIVAVIRAGSLHDQA